MKTFLLVLSLLIAMHVSAAEPCVRVYQKNGKGFVHDNLEASAAAIQELGKANGFGADVSSDPTVFTDESLKKYKALVFANSNNHLAASWPWMDECYFFTKLNPKIHVLLTVDTATLKDPKLATEPGEKAGEAFPLAWCHEFDGRRVFYTALGHRIAAYADPAFQQHLLGGIRWAMGAAGSP